MISGIASRRYAKGLLQLAIDNDTLKQQLADMQLITSVFNGSRELQLALVSPVIKDSKKKTIVSEIFAKKVSETTNRLIDILSAKGRLSLLSGTAHAFQDLYNQHAGILEVTIRTAFQMDSKQIDSVVSAFSKSIGLTVQPTIIVDSSLIGGITLTYRDTVIDGSIKNKLEQLTGVLQASAV
ncbi:MAG: F-type H+-transporting ATPase delta subunit AtpH [Bacteroidetes bacterium HLUCCA01]|nr:MAG: F-type H+-transporting ATPase delta subunit AtpH [Bacteroidetes bacterium HLUCCA01]